MYSPFSKPIHELDTKDLAILKDLPEGWFIEYKREMIEPEKIAKSVAAFANTDGGWLLFGIADPERTSEDEMFPGIPKTDAPINRQQIVQAVSQHINPIPYFYTRVLDGPCSDINLKEDFSIIAIQVPYSHRTPHIQHPDGVIYQRTSDHSDPVPQTDRFKLDLLWQRGEEVTENIRQWVAHDPEFTADERDSTYFRLLLMVDPWMPIPETWIKADRTKVKEILNSSAFGDKSNFFDIVHTYLEGYLCRDFSWGQPTHYGLTFQVFRNLSCELNVPLPILRQDYFVGSLNFEAGYAHREQYYHLLEKQNHTASKIVDLNVVSAYIGTVVDKYLKLLKFAQVSPAFRFKAKLLNASRVVPFIDSKVVIDYFETYGLPMIMHRDFEFPSGSGINSFFQIEEIENDKIADKQGTRVFIQFLRSLGIDITDHFEELVPEFLMCLLRATGEYNRLKSFREDREDENEDGTPTRL
ncbi:MAG: ATP-binding protein [Gammaproteobacteria bacterium]|nr:ATP-binding protein [Gammaproteobacteria bacterium]MYF52754.1 ATP-binding protein [Gammaproteobacteria bacterium]MYK44546.1 ATP-binding protein [Gammaproteobacteria bacterium]